MIRANIGEVMDKLEINIFNNLIKNQEDIHLVDGLPYCNICKEPRFFLEPNFEFSDKVFGDKNAFSPINHWPDAVRFPVRLEYGEMVSRTYILPIQSKQLFEQANSKNPAVTLRACAQNTLGNVFYSDSVSVLTIINFLSK